MDSRKTARELMAELSEAIRKQRKKTPGHTFNQIIGDLLYFHEIELSHIVALGMTSCFDPVTPHGPEMVLESYSNAINKLPA